MPKDFKTDIPNCQIHKYTSQIQIQLMTKCQEYQTYAIFLNSVWFKDVKNDKFPSVQSLIVKFRLCIVPPGLFLLMLW